MKTHYYIMAMAVSAFVCICTASACDDKFSEPPPPPSYVQYEHYRMPQYYSDVVVLHDDKRGVTCYVTGGTGGGISCVRVNPSTDDAGAKP